VLITGASVASEFEAKMSAEGFGGG
jgi:hypothetical protein